MALFEDETLELDNQEEFFGQHKISENYRGKACNI